MWLSWRYHWVPWSSNKPIKWLKFNEPVHPDKAKQASPVTYIDKNDPPFLIVQGEKDESVNPDQAITLSEKLKAVGVKNDLIIVPNAPHYGVMFDAENIRQKIFEYLGENLK